MSYLEKLVTAIMSCKKLDLIAARIETSAWVYEEKPSLNRSQSNEHHEDHPNVTVDADFINVGDTFLLHRPAGSTAYNLPGKVARSRLKR